MAVLEKGERRVAGCACVPSSLRVRRSTILRVGATKSRLPRKKDVWSVGRRERTKTGNRGREKASDTTTHLPDGVTPAIEEASPDQVMPATPGDRRAA
jgi:hypothetical protein